MNQVKLPYSRAAHRGRLAYFRMASTGVPFDALVESAEPLITLYNIDVDQLKKGEEPFKPEELEMISSLLELSRLLWAFYGLSDSAQVRCYPLMLERFVGPFPDEDEAAGFSELVDELSEHYHANFTKSQRTMAEQSTEANTFTFPELLTYFAPDDMIPATEEIAGYDTYGPDNLLLPDAMAQFSAPLMENANDPDTMDEVLARVSDYWELATAPLDLYPDILAGIINTYASDKQNEDVITAEASKMVERFHRLFPKQTRRSV